MKKALFVISVPGQVPELRALAIELKKREEYLPYFYFNRALPTADVLADFTAHGIPTFAWNKRLVPWGFPDQLGQAREKSPVITDANRIGFFTPIKAYLRRFLGALFYLPRLRWRIKLERNFLHREKFSQLILAEDSFDYHTPTLIRLGRELNLPTVIFPYTLADAQEFAEGAYVCKNFLWKPQYFFISVLFPKWVRFHRARRVVKSSAHLILANEYLGTSPPNPWVMNSGRADRIAVESPYMFDYYRNAGISESQLSLTGFASLDRLAEELERRDARKKELYEIHGFDPALPLMLCSVLPTQAPRRFLDPQFRDYEDFLEKYAVILRSWSGMNVLFKFHPRVKPEDYSALCARLNLQVTPDETTSLIPACDVFIASVSATIRWALLCGKPVINFDAYGYRYKDFKDAPGLLVAETLPELEFQLEKILDPERRASLKEELAPKKSYWGVADGKSVDRILELFKELETTPAAQSQNN